MLKLSQKQRERRDRFNKLGTATNCKIGDPDVPDYTTGNPSLFCPTTGACKDPVLILRSQGELYGPAFKTPQWKRTT